MEYNFSKSITKSGVTLWTLSAPHFNSVSIGVVVRCGTRDEIWPKEAGIAHALEHMHFQGTENFPNSLKLSEYVEEIGGRMNASTGKERTFYYSRVPIGYAERAVRVISEQIKKSIFPEEKIPVEMKNIVQEMNRRNDDPPRYLGKLAMEFIYNNHPLSKDGLGTEESVSSFKREDFLNFKKRYYDPSNYVFLAVGNISEKEALELFNKYFEEQSKIEPNIIKSEMVSVQLDKILIEKKELKQLHIRMNALIGAGKDKSSLYLDFFVGMISGGMSFPLFQEVRDKRGLCYSIGSSIAEYSDVGFFDIYIGTDHKRYKEAISATLEVIEKSKSDENLLNKVKNLMIGRLLLSYENTSNIIHMAAGDITFLGYPRGFQEVKKEMEEVTIDNIKRAVDMYLKPEQILTTMLAPNDFVAD